MRHGVVDGGAVVHVLRAAGDVQAVERGFAALGRHDDVDLVAHQPAAERHGVRAEVAAALLLDLQRLEVERLLALALDLVMVQVGVFAKDDFCHRVGEIRAVGADVALHDGRLGVAVADDQRTRMARNWLAVRVPDVNQVQRLAQNGSARQIEEQAVAQEGGIEGHERGVVVVGILSQVRRHQFAVPLQGRSQAAQHDARRQPGRLGKTRHILAVDQHGTRARPDPRQRRLHALDGQVGQALRVRRHKRRLGERGQRREAPLLVARSRQAQCCEALDRGRAQGSEAVAFAGTVLALEGAEMR